MNAAAEIDGKSFTNVARDWLKAPENKGSTIVYDLRSSHAVPDVIKSLGGVARTRLSTAFVARNEPLISVEAKTVDPASTLPGAASKAPNLAIWAIRAS